MTEQNRRLNARPFVVGAVLLDEWGASPSMGEAAGDEPSKTAHLKVIRTAEGIRPVLTSQSVGSWHLDALHTHFAWEPSKIAESVFEKSGKQISTQANPIRFPEDDGRGYNAMFALESKVGSEKKRLPLFTKRLSPFKLSSFQSVVPIRSQVEWGILARGLDQVSEAAESELGEELGKLKENMLWKAEVAATAYEGAFSLNVGDLGVFAVGPGRDMLSEDDLRQALALGDGEPFNERRDQIAIGRFVGAKRGARIALQPEVRLGRAQDLLLAVADLEGGAQVTQRLRNIAPGTALVAFMNGTHSLPGSVFAPATGEECATAAAEIHINVDRIIRILTDYSDRFVSDTVHNVFFGSYGTGSVANEEEFLEALQKEAAKSRPIFRVVTDSDPEPDSVDTDFPIRIRVCRGPRAAFKEAARCVPADWFTTPQGSVVYDESLAYGQELLERL